MICPLILGTVAAFYTVNRFRLSALFGILFALLGCVASNPIASEYRVRLLAQSWLDAIMAFDFQGAYAYTSPGYQTAHSVAHYSRNYAGRGMWKSAVLGPIRCDGIESFGRCEVEVVVTYRGLNMPTDIDTTLTEVWVNVDGNWYTWVD